MSDRLRGNRISLRRQEKIIARFQNEMKYSKSKAFPPIADRLSNNHQIISFPKILLIWLLQSSEFTFGRGFCWGTIVGLTAAISATFGIVLTRIDTVEQTIARTIGRTQTNSHNGNNLHNVSSNNKSPAHFAEDFKPEQVVINLLSQYTQRTSVDTNSRQARSLESKSESTVNPVPMFQEATTAQDISIAVQNTTENPELGMRLVSYLRSQNFPDVYLVEHIPLRLKKTRIILNQNQIAKAEHLKDILGLSGLEEKISTISQPLTIQIGEDAGNLLLNNSIDKPFNQSQYPTTDR